MEIQCEERNCLEVFDTDDGDEHYCMQCHSWYCAEHFEKFHNQHEQAISLDWRLYYQR